MIILRVVCGSLLAGITIGVLLNYEAVMGIPVYAIALSVIYLAIAMVFTAGINEGHWDREKVYIDPANEEHQEHTRRVERARTLDGYLAILWPIFMPFYVLIHRRRIQIREQTADQPDLDDKYLTQAASR